jgi:LysR family glycine cleavage system transcriptional activator
MGLPLPPLNSLRAFEVAARLLSVTNAAVELNVTPPAISHHIKTLEEYYGVTLFAPSRRKLSLTEAGRRFLPELSVGFNHLLAASNKLRTLGSGSHITVALSGSLAMKWLIPQLPKFNNRFPDVPVRVAASPLLIEPTEKELDNGDLDIVIRFGSGHYPGYTVHPLLPETAFPVCSPKLVTKQKPLSVPDDLRHHTLIYDEGYMHYAQEGSRFQTTFPDWSMWCDAAGVDISSSHQGATFATSAMAIQAALDGQGVILGRSAMAYDDLISGRLIKPFKLAVNNIFAYYMICSENKERRPEVMAFQSWLSEIALTTQRAPILN